jgi:23S rRNA (adenine2030-N6)-methyltransferase
VNYQHAYHAGNIADVFKHCVLIEILRALQKKPTPFCVLDTHAGSGIYRLKPNGEHEQGIGLLWPERTRWPLLADYFAAIEKFNGTGPLKHYPGSPLIISTFLRATPSRDRAVLIELHPEEYKKLKENSAGTNGAAVHHVDAWNGLKAFVPPPENRGLVLIDPPYEEAGEFKRVVLALSRALKHWRNGIYMVWYPIKARQPVAEFLQAVRGLQAKVVAAEFLTLPTDMEQRLNGSGVVIINPPWKLLQHLKTLLPPLARRLAGSTGKPQTNFYDLHAK